jgi:hypothetical protein
MARGWLSTSPDHSPAISSVCCRPNSIAAGASAEIHDPRVRKELNAHATAPGRNASEHGPGREAPGPRRPAEDGGSEQMNHKDDLAEIAGFRGGAVAITTWAMGCIQRTCQYPPRGEP